MKPPTSDDITRQLQQAHFPEKHGRAITAVPVGDTPMVVSLEQLRPYELNPRVIRNPLYDELKASIRGRGLDQPPAITRRPDEQHFIIRNGGNTRSLMSESTTAAPASANARAVSNPMPCAAPVTKATCPLKS